MNQPPYGDQGYGLDADPNEPGNSTRGYDRHGNQAEPGAYGNQAQRGPYGAQGQPGQPGPYGNPDQPRQPNGPGAVSKPNFLDSLKGGAGGIPPKTLAIIGGAILLVIILLLVIVFGVFGDSEERDRKSVVKAANRTLDVMRESDKFSDLNDMMCSRYQADEDIAEEIDEVMADFGYSLAETFHIEGMLDGVEVTERDVEFTTDRRREASVIIDYGYDRTWLFRHIDGDWVPCGPLDFSHVDNVDDIENLSW